MFELLLGPCYCNAGFYTVQDLYIIYGWCIQNEKVGICRPQCALMILKTCLLDYRSHSMLSFAQRFIRRCLAAVGRSLCNLHSLIHIYNYIFMCFYVLSLPTFYFRSIKFVQKAKNKIQTSKKKKIDDYRALRLPHPVFFFFKFKSCEVLGRNWHFKKALPDLEKNEHRVAFWLYAVLSSVLFTHRWVVVNQKCPIESIVIAIVCVERA